MLPSLLTEPFWYISLKYRHGVNFKHPPIYFADPGFFTVKIVACVSTNCLHRTGLSTVSQTTLYFFSGATLGFAFASKYSPPSTRSA